MDKQKNDKKYEKIQKNIESILYGAIDDNKDAINIAALFMISAKNILVSVYGKEKAKEIIKEYIEKLI